MMDSRVRGNDAGALLIRTYAVESDYGPLALPNLGVSGFSVSGQSQG
jgi:hypothetical protein